MILPDSYKGINAPAAGEYKDRGSRFMAFAKPVFTAEEARNFVKDLRKEHHAAAHVCWAYILGYDASEIKSSDDREPSGSAGKPIQRTLQEKNLTHICMAVVRYFGGKLLGVPGLIHAYGEASRAALQAASVRDFRIYQRIFMPCGFEQQHEVITVLKHELVKFYPDYYNSQSGITFEISPQLQEKVTQELLKLRMGTPQFITTLHT